MSDVIRCLGNFGNPIEEKVSDLRGLEALESLEMAGLSGLGVTTRLHEIRVTPDRVAGFCDAETRRRRSSGCSPLAEDAPCPRGRTPICRQARRRDFFFLSKKEEREREIRRVIVITINCSVAAALSSYGSN